MVEGRHEEYKELAERLKEAIKPLGNASYLDTITQRAKTPNCIKGFVRFAYDIANRIEKFALNPPESAIWTEGSEKYPKLKVTDINADDFLEDFWETKKNILLTSATISVNDSFRYMARRLGINVKYKTGIYETPFDYKEQMKYVIPKDFDPSNDKDFDDKVMRAIKRIVDSGFDKTLILFTSYRQMNDLLRHIKREFGDEYLVLEQSKNLSKGFILNKFRDEEKAILVAQAASFGTGVDVKGNKNIILAKLNFDNPSDPIVKARGIAIKKAGGNEFMDLAIPTVCLKTKQQVGRGIRSSSDRAYVGILDGRLLTRRWGKIIRNSLPPRGQKTIIDYV